MNCRRKVLCSDVTFPLLLDYSLKNIIITISEDFHHHHFKSRMQTFLQLFSFIFHQELRTQCRTFSKTLKTDRAKIVDGRRRHNWLTHLALDWVRSNILRNEIIQLDLGNACNAGIIDNASHSFHEFFLLNGQTRFHEYEHALQVLFNQHFQLPMC